jgi:hypothetical protein
VNLPFELADWHCGLRMAQRWRVRAGERRLREWDSLTEKLSLLAREDSRYLAARTATDTYKDVCFTSDHTAVLGASGIVFIRWEGMNCDNLRMLFYACGESNIAITRKAVIDWQIRNEN